MVKIVHTGDIHFDTPFSSLPPQLVALRQEEVRQTFSKIITYTKKNKADILLIAGDLFDSATVLPQTISFLAEQFSRIPTVKIFIAAGNHDPLIEDSFYQVTSFPENVHIFGTTLEQIQLPELQTCVYGVSFQGQYQSESLLKSFHNSYDGISILLLHGDLTAASPYDPITLQEIANSNVTYLALGHVHNHTGVLKAGTTSYAYCGAPEGRGFDEEGQKGFLSGELTPVDANLTFIPCSSRTYYTHTIDISGLYTTDAIKNKILELASDRRGLYKIILTGQSEAVQLPVLETLLNETLFYCKLVNQTVRQPFEYPPHTLRGQLLQQLSSSDAPEAALALEIGLAALEGRAILNED